MPRKRSLLIQLARGIGFIGVATLAPSARALMAGATPDTPAARVDANRADSPWAGVGAVVVDKSIYTGALVHPRFVITAAHVAGHAPNGEFRLNTGDNPSHRMKIARAHLHPEYRGFVKPVPFFDLALLELVEAAASNLPIYPFYFGTIRLGTVLTFVGYGASGHGDLGALVDADASVKRIGRNRVDRFFDLPKTPGTPGVFLYDFDGPEQESNIYGGPTLGNGDETAAASGDSGAPVFIVRGGYRVIVGVLSFVGDLAQRGKPNSTFGTGGGGTLVGPAQGWINDVLGHAPNSALPKLRQ